VRDARLVPDHVLGPKGDLRGLLGGQREGLVERVRVQRLRPAEHRRERLERRPHDVVLAAAAR
jgi:hypothetical protein